MRTGFGGVHVIRDGGALMIPFVHELVRVSLQTIKLEVQRENEVALITKDKLRADIRAEFFVRVQPDVESILQASRSRRTRSTVFWATWISRRKSCCKRWGRVWRSWQKRRSRAAMGTSVQRNP